MLFFEKGLNNNVAIALDEKKTEVIVIGKGIGFNTKKGNVIDEKKIDKIYRVNEKEKISKLLEDISIDVIEAAEKIIDKGAKIIGKQLNGSMLLTLSDHLTFSLERIRNGIEIKSPLKWEIPHLYPHEHEAGCEALKIVEEHLGVTLPIDEASFIAIHFVNAQYEDQSMKETMQVTEIISYILDIIDYNFHINLNEESLNKSRFITHLRYLVMRQNGSSHSAKLEDELLFNTIKNNYPASYQCALKIARYLSNKYKWTIDEDEIIYLTIHIEKVLLDYNALKEKPNKTGV